MANLTGDDLKTYLQATGLLAIPLTALQSLLDFDSAMAAATEEFERRTGYLPFLSDGEVSTRQCRSEGNSVFFDGGLIALDGGADAITTGAANFTAGQNVQLLPLNAPARRKPYTYLQFLSPNSLIYSPFVYVPSDGYPAQGLIGGRTITLSVRGKWGFCLTLPPDVRLALIQKGAAVLASQIALQQSGRVKSWKSGTTEEEYFDLALKGQVPLWEAAFEKVVTKPAYRLIR